MSVRSRASYHPSGVASILGIDLSLTSTGLASISWPGGVDALTSTAPVIETTRIRPKTRDHERLQLILQEVSIWAETSDLILLEGPAYGAKSASYHQLAGCWWLVRHELWAMGKPVAVVSPPARAKYAAGKGTAGKDEVLAAVIRRYAIPLDIEVDGNDVADAVTMAAMGARHVGRPVEDRIPELNAQALEKVDWP